MIAVADRRPGETQQCAENKNQFVMDNVSDGFDLHQLDNGAYIRTFLTRDAKKRVPKQVVFSKDTTVVVGGSDHGKVYIFDRRTGKEFQVLHHGDGGVVQTVTVRWLIHHAFGMLKCVA